MNPARRLWIILKLMYLYALYWLVGMEDDYYHMMKAHYFVELKKYRRAIRSCEKALKHSNHPYIHSTLSYCYIQTGKYSNSAEYYRTVSDTDNPKSALRLAWEELTSGNIDGSNYLIDKIKDMDQKLDSLDRQRLGRIEEAVAMAERGRGDLNKYKNA